MKRLIIVEGLPGTGKSTTASVIADKLKNQGQKVLKFPLYQRMKMDSCFYPHVKQFPLG